MPSWPDRVVPPGRATLLPERVVRGRPVLRVCTALLQAEVNIIQAYPLLVRPRGMPAVALMVDNIEMGLETLAAKGFAMISEGDLSCDDE